MRAKRENISAGTNNLFNVSLKNFSCWKEYQGIGYVELKKGYKPIIDAIIEPHAKGFFSKLKLRHYMKKIYICHTLDTDKSEINAKTECQLCEFISDPAKVVIRMCNNSGHKPLDFFVICDKVICTMSLGYLKENLNLIIDPIGMIKSKRRLAVQRLGFGVINKIFLLYAKPFWNESIELIHMVWLPDDEDFQLNMLTHRSSNKRLWTEDVCKIEVCSGYENTLCMWIAGSELFEQLDDVVVTSECTKLLMQFFKIGSIPEPVSIMR